MSLDLNKRVARRYFKAYEKGDVDAVMHFIDSDYTLHPGGGAGPMNFDERRLDELVFFSAFSNIRTTVEDQIAEDDRVANRITMRCSHTGQYHGIPRSGKRIVITYMDIVLLRAGKIVEEWVEFDLMSILRQIGVDEHRQ